MSVGNQLGSAETRIRIMALMAAALAALFVPPVSGQPSLVPTACMRGLAAAMAAGLLVGPGWIGAALAVLGAAVSTAWLVALHHSTFSPTVATLVVAACAQPVIATLARRLGRRGPDLLALLGLGGSLAWFGGVLVGPFSGAALQARLAMANTALSPEGYGWDGLLYLRVRQLLIEGRGYYPAFRQAVEEDGRLTAAGLFSVFNVREPLLFRFWSLLPSVNAVYFAFLGLAMIALVSAYAVARRQLLPGWAMVVGLSLLPFYACVCSYNPYSPNLPWFTLMEFWASGLMLAAFALLAYNRPLLSILVLTTAVGVRELAVLFVPAWIVWWWFTSRSRRWIPLAACGLPVTVLAIHFARASAIITPGSENVANHWFRGNVGSLRRLIYFCWDYMPYVSHSLPILAVVALLGSLLIIPRGLGYALMYSVSVPLVLLAGMSASEIDFYWGAVITPLVVVVGVMALPLFTLRLLRIPASAGRPQDSTDPIGTPTAVDLTGDPVLSQPPA